MEDCECPEVLFWPLILETKCWAKWSLHVYRQSVSKLWWQEGSSCVKRITAFMMRVWTFGKQLDDLIQQRRSSIHMEGEPIDGYKLNKTPMYRGSLLQRIKCWGQATCEERELSCPVCVASQKCLVGQLYEPNAGCDGLCLIELDFFLCSCWPWYVAMEHP